MHLQATLAFLNESVIFYEYICLIIYTFESFIKSHGAIYLVGEKQFVKSVVCWNSIHTHFFIHGRPRERIFEWQ